MLGIVSLYITQLRRISVVTRVRQGPHSSPLLMMERHASDGSRTPLYMNIHTRGKIAGHSFRQKILAATKHCRLSVQSSSDNAVMPDISDRDRSWFSQFSSDDPQLLVTPAWAERSLWINPRLGDSLVDSLPSGGIQTICRYNGVSSTELKFRRRLKTYCIGAPPSGSQSFGLLNIVRRTHLPSVSSRFPCYDAGHFSSNYKTSVLQTRLQVLLLKRNYFWSSRVSKVEQMETHH